MEELEIEEQYKKILRTQLRAMQDLVYGDCMREDRTLDDIYKCVEKMATAFNIDMNPFKLRTPPFEDFKKLIEKYNTTETGY